MSSGKSLQLKFWSVLLPKALYHFRFLLINKYIFLMFLFDQNTRLAFLFQENAQKFIDLFSEHRSRMWQFLSDLEETAVKLNEMKTGASISTVAGSSVGIFGGILSISGLILAPFTGGVSLGLTLAGAGLGGISAVNSLVTGVTEMAVNSHHEHNAQSYLKGYQDDMRDIVRCLKEVANSERPLVRPSAVDVENVLNVTKGVVEGAGDVMAGAAAVAEHKSKNVITAATEITVTGLDDTPQVAINLSEAGQLARAETLFITKSVRVASGILNVLFIGVDGYLLTKESISLHKGNESEVSQLIRSRAVLWKSELDTWEKIHKSLCIGIKTISESKDTLEKPFLP
ncbi:putative apolipoprotein L4 [Triplophysa rosa]|uniref:Apolipoprotein L4 n=1 Tax=Triplophysa rosa TaxID=992332 RepID=A0A9W8CAW6_TRIRA|nr:putative apolipoprotein L4 [Triplophysa rosa]